MKSADDSGQIDLSEIRTIIWRRKWLIIIPMILVAAITYIGSTLIEPVYESSVIIWVGKSFSLSDGLQRMLGDDFSRSRPAYERRDELRSLQNEIISTPYIRQLIQRLELDKDPTLDNMAQKMQTKWPHLTIDQIKFTMLLTDLRKRIGIDFSGLDQVMIRTEASDPFMARDMAQNLGEIFMAEKMKQQMGAVRLSQDFSYEQLERYEQDLEDKIAERTVFEQEYLNVQLDDLVISDQNRRNITSEIEAAKTEISDREEEAAAILARISEIPSNRINLVESDELKRIKKDLKNHLRSINDLMLKHNWTSSEILNFKARLYSYMDDIEAENKVLVNEQYVEYDNSTRDNVLQLINTRAHLDMLYSKKNDLELAYADLQNKKGLIPEYQARLDQLDREVEAAREILDRIKQQQESAQISQAILRESEFKVIQPAQIPLSPIRPDNRRLLVMGIILGLIVGGGIVFLVELMDNSYRKVNDVEKHLDLPVIGVVPIIESAKKIKTK